ncbi:MAG: MFS transporter [Rhodospirillaceae bacterium]
MALGFDFSVIRATLRGNFAIFTAANSVSVIGTWVQRVAVGWLTWDLTHSGAWLGAVSMAEFMPVILLAPLMGVMADRFDRRRMAVAGQCLAALQALALAVLSLTGNITALMVFALQLVAGVIQPLIQSARLVLVPTLVPRENLGNAVAITSMTFNIARIIGPALSGLLITSIGAGYSFLVNAVSYIGVIAALASLKLPPHVHQEGRESWHGIWQDLVDGWRYTFAHPTLRWAIPLITFVATLLWPLTDLMAGFAGGTFGMGAGGLAILTSAQGLGALIGGLYLASRTDHGDLHRLMVWAMVMNGLLVALFASMPVFWAAVPVLLINGMFSVVVGSGSQTVTQMASTDTMRGRTLSIWYLVTRVGPAMGGLLLGSLASLMGFRIPIASAGLIVAATAAVFAVRYGRRA